MVLRYYIPRLAQCLLVAHHGNWVPCGPRLNCAGSRSGLEPQRYCAHGPVVCGTRPGTYQSNHLLPCRLCFFRQRLRESTLTENPVWSPVGRLAVMAGRVGSEYFQSTRVRVLSTSEVLEYEYFSPFYKSTRVRVQSTQNVLMNTLMSTFRC